MELFIELQLLAWPLPLLANAVLIQLLVLLRQLLRELHLLLTLLQNILMLLKALHGLKAIFSSLLEQA